MKRCRSRTPPRASSTRRDISRKSPVSAGMPVSDSRAIAR
jgi:hypothetical protein